jgi:hypothetical protein
MNDTVHVGRSIGLSLQFPTLAKAIEKTSIVLSSQIARFRNAFNDPSDFLQPCLASLMLDRLSTLAHRFWVRIKAPLFNLLSAGSADETDAADRAPVRLG